MFLFYDALNPHLQNKKNFVKHFMIVLKPYKPQYFVY